MPSSQRPFFLSSFLAAFRQQPPSLAASSAQPNKHTHTQAVPSGPSSSSPSSSSSAAAVASSSAAQARPGSVVNQLPLHSPRAQSGAMPIPGAAGRRRGSDSSSEGFREVLGADKWYIGGRTAAGEEKFFKLGVVRRVRSGDRLSIDRLSL